jgi:hypothetical protein
MDAASVIRIALSVISDRLIVILALIANAVMCGWVMWGEGWERVAALAIFSIFSYLLVKAKEAKNGTDSES